MQCAASYCSVALGHLISSLNTHYHGALGGEPGSPPRASQTSAPTGHSPSSLTSPLLSGVANCIEKKSTMKRSLFYSAVYRTFI